MPPRSDTARLTRLKIWIVALTLVPACALLVSGRSTGAAGFSSGGLIVFLNLLGTQRTVALLVEGGVIERLAALVIWFAKLGVTAAFILVLLYSSKVSQLALLAGLASLPVSIVFDIFFFPVNKGEAKTP